MNTNNLSPQEVATAIIDKMREEGHAYWIDPEVHSQHHEFIAEMIQERKERKARRDRIQEKIAGSVLLSGLLFVIGLLGAGVISWIKEHLA